MDPQAFEFILIDETGKPEQGLKRKVRSHSSRAGWARHSHPPPEHHPEKRRRRRRPLESTTFIGTEGAPDEKKPLPGETSSVPPNKLLMLDFGGVRSDPFKSYPPVRWVSLVPSLVDHYIVHMAVDIPELDQPQSTGHTGLLRTRWFPLVLSESAAFQIILLLSASNFTVVSSAAALDIRPWLLQMKCDAIRAINDAFTSDDKRVSDAVIGAVAKMASFEAMYGTVEAYKIHMSGLQKMVTIRGGLSALGLGGLLRRIIVWIDVNSALLLGTPRFFPRATFMDVLDSEDYKGLAEVETNLERFVAI